MTARETTITKAILTLLNRLDGAQAIELIIHASVQTDMRNQGDTAASLREFEGALRNCDQNGWVIGVAAKVTKQMKWSISDAGRAALMELA